MIDSLSDRFWEWLAQRMPNVYIAVMFAALRIEEDEDLDDHHPE